MVIQEQKYFWQRTLLKFSFQRKTLDGERLPFACANISLDDVKNVRTMPRLYCCQTSTFMLNHAEPFYFAKYANQKQKLNFNAKILARNWKGFMLNVSGYCWTQCVFLCNYTT